MKEFKHLENQVFTHRRNEIYTERMQEECFFSLKLSLYFQHGWDGKRQTMQKNQKWIYFLNFFLITMIWKLLTTDKKGDGNSKTTENLTYTNIFSVYIPNQIVKNCLMYYKSILLQ